MKKAFLQVRTLSALAMASALVACGGGGGGGTAVNTAPVPADVTNVTVLAGSAFSFVLPAFTDAQGNTLTYSLTRADGSALPTGLSLD
jgi:spermidine/putrescine-binding protein